MGVVTYTEEFSTPIPAKRLFAGLILDGDNLIPKVMPQAVKSSETTGDGGPGSIQTLTFVEGAPMKYVKNRVDALDKERMTFSYTLIEVEGGDPAFPEKIESISYEIKYEATPEGGCKGTSVQKYNLKPGKEISEEEIKEGNAKAVGFFKAVEAYLLANPNAYA